MIVAVVIALALLGGATWSAQSYPIAHDRVRHRHVTGILLAAGAAALVAGAIYAVVLAS